MDRNRRFICHTSCRRRLIFRRTQSNLRCMSTKAAGSIAAAGVVWVPADEVWGRVVSMSVGFPAGGAVLGPGALADVVAIESPADGGGTWVVVVVVLVVAVVGKVGPPCGNAFQAPEARSFRYVRAILRYPDST
ncbi:hypothetical protein NDU88_001965 [Pleurodeles waltl]|uniref:Uncharacterized protein n=1 Tax=Pleurodeles waltl TaxID=8319 RepID=A0AAV7TJF3_PLEWA|nr:hypothetical protein NDU88_001965 [Pleurodeles waltl]